MSSKSDEVNNFLKRFAISKDISDVLSGNCCYWFAAILFGRFIRDGASVMFDESKNHFGTQINGRVYDITGDVTDFYKWDRWDSITDTSLRNKIIENYIMF